ncbi:MipA/OmpV family protein [Loktanella sp. F6476L]|uniref:MipA/OmpV family protein n=1 Tax=Loktanella sp. F6476L TaxID=2926405 RepID=UPI001FF16AB2|nr:MipA/OmpV family protein [Loktanella sp. F6476L]MCK0122704.1 MipA/OmpV family protein [Loktanella sp. F6476L]
MCKRLLALAFMCAGTSASADGPWTIGVFATGATDVYLGDDQEVGFAPIISYDTDRLHIGVDGLSYQFYDYGLGQLDVVLGYRGAPVFPDKNPRFAGLKRDDAVEAGISTQLAFGNAYVGLNTLTDITDAHGGTEADLTIGYTTLVGDVQFDASVGARYRTAKLNQFLYGVSDVEATTNRRAYTANDTTTAFADITIGYAVTDAIIAVAQIGYEDIGENIDSPLTSKSSALGVGLGLVWSF